MPRPPSRRATSASPSACWRRLEGLDRENVDRERAGAISRPASPRGRGASRRPSRPMTSWPSTAEPSRRGAGAPAPASRSRCSDRTIDAQGGHRRAGGAVGVAGAATRSRRRRWALLGRLYAEESRWRDAFTMARRANELYPDNDDDAHALRRGGQPLRGAVPRRQGATRSRALDAIALYFDFKEFTPPGRRGDEMIRRLAERLVALDLLGEAADLLQHQVDNRLLGRRQGQRRHAARRDLPDEPPAGQGLPGAARQPARRAAGRTARSRGAAGGARAVRPVAHRPRARNASRRRRARRSTACAPTSCGRAGAGARPARSIERIVGDAGRAPAPLDDAPARRRAARRHRLRARPTTICRWTGCGRSSRPRWPTASTPAPSPWSPRRPGARAAEYREVAKLDRQRRHAGGVPRRVPQALSRHAAGRSRPTPAARRAAGAAPGRRRQPRRRTRAEEPRRSRRPSPAVGSADGVNLQVSARARSSAPGCRRPGSSRRPARRRSA